MVEASSSLTQALRELNRSGGVDRGAADRVFVIVHSELRRIAGRLMRDERTGHTLQPTALVHEAYLRLVGESQVEWKNRAHFFGIAARAMRQILVDHSRQRSAAKRGGDWERVALGEEIGGTSDLETEVRELDEALARLAELDERMAQVVELRVFAGLSAERVADVLGVSRRTVFNDWRVARMWLMHELLGEEWEAVDRDQGEEA